MDIIVMHNMTSRDIPDVLKIEKLSFATPWSKEAFENEVCRNLCARYQVACLDGRVIGYGGMWVILDEGHITNIAVHPSYRGMGAGNMIVEALIRIAKAEGVKSMTLEVRRTNLIAQKLYEKYGFTAEGVRPRYYGDNGEDAIIMWKRDL